MRVDAGNLVLVSVRPTAGYTVAEQRARPDDVEVRFEVRRAGRGYGSGWTAGSCRPRFRGRTG